MKKILCSLGIHSIPKIKVIDLHFEKKIDGYKYNGNQIYADYKTTGCKWCDHQEIEKQFYIADIMDVPLNRYMTIKTLVNKTPLWMLT